MESWNALLNLWQKIVLEFNKFDTTSANAPGYSIYKEKNDLSR